MDLDLAGLFPMIAGAGRAAQKAVFRSCDCEAHVYLLPDGELDGVTGTLCERHAADFDALVAAQC